MNKQELITNGNELKEVRQRLQVTQQELAHLVGCHVQTIINLETGNRKGSEETWKQVNLALAILSNSFVFIDKDGKQKRIDIEKAGAFIEMITTAKKHGYSFEVVTDFFVNIQWLFHELIESQQDMVDEEQLIIDKKNLEVLKKMKENLLKPEYIKEYFETWLLK